MIPVGPLAVQTSYRQGRQRYELLRLPSVGRCGTGIGHRPQWTTGIGWKHEAGWNLQCGEHYTRCCHLLLALIDKWLAVQNVLPRDLKRIIYNFCFPAAGRQPAGTGRHRPATRTGRPATSRPAAGQRPATGRSPAGTGRQPAPAGRQRAGQRPATGRQPHGQRPATGRHPFGMQRGPPAMETSYTILGGWFWSKAFASNMQPSCKVFTT